MKITRIGPREFVARTINCGGPLALRPSILTNLKGGIDTIGRRFRYCVS